MPVATPSHACQACGAEMDLVDAWSTKSPPLIGRTTENAEYRCPDCGHDALLERGPDDAESQPS